MTYSLEDVDTDRSAAQHDAAAAGSPVPPSAADLAAPLARLRLTGMERAGGKGANLGELLSAGFPVPDGFVVLAAAFRTAVQAAGTGSELARLHREALAAARHRPGHGAMSRLPLCCRRLQDTVRAGGMPSAVLQAIDAGYAALGHNPAVAVRSSAVEEDSPAMSYAGMNASFTNVRGMDAVSAAVLECWASVFSPRAVTYRAEQGSENLPDIAVVVQLMVRAEKAGVAFTADPVSGRRDRMVVEAAWGQGEVVVSGRVEPDTYVLDTDGPRLLDVRRGSQTSKIVAAPGGGDRARPLDVDDRGPVLSPEEAERVAALALQVQAHHGRPQDVEWAVTGADVWLVQARPVTTLTVDGSAGDDSAADDGASTPCGAPLLHGLGASAGRAPGRVRVLLSPADGHRLADGEVLVAPLTNPDWIPAVRRAAALVTDTGGLTCHAAIVARELGVPAVVGTRTATRILQDGDEITVDGTSGDIWPGRVAAPAAIAAPRGTSLGPTWPSCSTRPTPPCFL